MIVAKSDLKKVIAVIGPTASGKTSLSIKLAKQLNGELINADSRQIYKFMDIGTAKGDYKTINSKYYDVRKLKLDGIDFLPLCEIENVRIHLLNVCLPDRILSLFEYKKLAEFVISDIVKRKKLPIMVGGTGLYFDAIFNNYIIPKTKTDQENRRKLEKLSIVELHKIIKQLSEKKLRSLNNSDANNKRRLIRIIEILRQTDRKEPKKGKKKYDFIFVSPFKGKEELIKAIKKRAKIIVSPKLIQEYQLLKKKGYDSNLPSMTTICYKYVDSYLKGEISKTKLVELFADGDVKYAKKQITWFKRYKVTILAKKRDFINFIESQKKENSEYEFLSSKFRVQGKK